LNPSDVTIDFTSEALGMLSNLMLAQAQYLFYKKASDAGMKAATLAKIAMQVAEYFKKAYDLSQTNQYIKAYDGGKFANIMQYHSLYFAGMAYFVIAQEEYKVANEKSNGMGKVVGLFKRTTAEFDKAKPVIGLIPSNYQENFNKRYQEVIAMRDKAIKENNTVYFDRELPIDQVPKPDMQNFVKLEAALDNLAGKLAIEEKLRHIVPPQVRVMQVEVKQKL
jgi:BRO1-like domain